jgi:multicomponent Na+:H+ antiporter subunit C
MEGVYALVVGGLYAAGFYLLLRRSPVRVIVGLAFLSHAAHLLIFVSAGLTRGRPPLVAEGATAPAAPFADPLPQALVLTAIVISFALLAFALVLFYRTHQEARSDDLDRVTHDAAVDGGEAEGVEE